MTLKRILETLGEVFRQLYNEPPGC